MSFSGHREPVNLLACDGGGIRGVSELVILDEIMRRMQQKANLAKVPKPCDYFHLIGGTSTGGLVAIMLGRLEMSTAEALKAYDSFAKEIFFKRRKSFVEKYKAKNLEETVKNLVREQGKGFAMRDGRREEAKGRAFVCTMPEQRHKEVVRLRSYDVEGDKYPNCLIVEAARATTAATTYFKPMPIKDEEGNEVRFVDAALGTNNPISILWEEATNLFGKKRNLGCVVSLGTGSREVEMEPNGDRVMEKMRYLVSALKVTKELGTDSERDHLRWKAKFEEFDNVYFRFNVDGGAQGIELSEWEKIGELKRRTRKYLQSPDVQKEIDELAQVLLTSKPSGLTLAHGGGLSKDTTIPAEPRFIRRGKSSNIFTGRMSILKRLDEHFGPRSPGDTSRREFHLRGMGGVGKTQVALKFTERNEQRFNILWIDATDVTTIVQGFKLLAANLFGPKERSDPVQDVLRWLEQSDEEWLLVFDNAPVSGLARFLPDGDRGNILYTSRHLNLQPRLRPDCVADIEEMDVQDSVLLLLRSAQTIDNTDENREFAKEIVRALGFLPLAIDQAGAYIHMAPCPLEKYLGVFNEQKEALLRSPRFKGGDELRHIAVYATFNISHKAIKAFADKKEDMARVKDAEVALKLLNLLCFYNNEGAIYSIFNEAAEFRHGVQRFVDYPLKAGDVSLEDLIWVVETEPTPEEPTGGHWDCEDFTRGMTFLHEFSLIKVNFSTAYSNMHVLVHDWARNRMGDKERSDWGSAARTILMDSLSLKTGIHYVEYRRDVIPHLEVCQKYVDVENDDPLLESEYQGKMANAFRQAGNLDAAEAALTKALEYRKWANGLLNEGTFAAMSQLARLYIDQGNYSKAEGMMREVLDRRRLLWRDMRWDALEEARREARKDGGDDDVSFPDGGDPLDHPKILKDTKGLLSVLVFLDEREAAANVCSEILEWYERAGKYDKVRTFRRYLATLRKEDLEGQKTVHDAYQQLADTQAVFGANHPHTFRDKAKLANLLKNEHSHLAAETLYREVYEWKQQAYGKDSMKTAEAWSEIARVQLSQGRAYEADEIYAALEAKYRKELGPLHPKTLEVISHLAMCRYMETLYDEAIRLVEECLDGQRIVLGPQHTLTIQSEHCLRQFRETQATAPDYLRAGLRNMAVEASLKVLGDRAPEWMRQWEPESEEELMLAHLARGPVSKMQLEIFTEGELVFTRLRPVDPVGQSQATGVVSVEDDKTTLSKDDQARHLQEQDR